VSDYLVKELMVPLSEYATVIKPVLSVVKASLRIASGNLESFIIPKGRNESSKLVRSFNEMVEGADTVQEKQI